MWRRPQELLHLLTRRHPRLFNAGRLTMVFLAAFGGSYGFISGSRSPQSGYDPHAFSIGVSFLFALSCVALATLTLRNRLLSRAMRKAVLQNEALADRNAELSAALDRERNLPDAQGDLIRVRETRGDVVEVNAAFASVDRGVKRSWKPSTPFATRA